MNAGVPKAQMVSVGEMIGRGERFLVPLYQRLYVWKPEQVERLMDDVLAAWQQDKPVYYLGGILAIRRKGEEPETEELELIDGQQRLTTLWLLAIAWHDEAGGESLADFVSVDGEPRLRFAIRENVNRFIRTALAGKPEASAETAAMESALSVVNTYPGAWSSSEPVPSRNELAVYIREKVKLALTEVPANTDLNKLFEVINNRGEQLQHHDILKQRLLNCIEAAEREAYARLWDACAAMDGYVERNLLNATGKSVKEAFDEWYRFSEPASLGATRQLISRIQGEVQKDEGTLLSLDDIKNENPAESEAETRSPDGDEAEEEPAIQSILSFPLLLQHGLRIFRHRRGISDLDHIHDQDLLAIFEQYFFSVSEWENDEEAAKAFIQLLWEIRAAFDAYVVKWIERDEGERRLDVRRIDAENGFTRTDKGVPRGLSLLQAVIYHSQGKTSQYWLTPFLNFALGNPVWGEMKVYLEYLDHFLFTRPSEKNLRELTHEMLTAKVPELVSSNFPAALSENSGTDFRRYWFYKTEYVLWKLREKSNLPDGWRIVARNSVEHIVPQKTIGGENMAGEWLDTFANLALVSREENSRFSNHSFSEKKKAYEANKTGTRSLKLDLVFSHEAAADETVRRVIEKHDKELKKAWHDYLGRLAGKVGQQLGGMG
jgi:hypothetical protein